MMQFKGKGMMVLVLAVLFMAAPSAQASVIINEIFADPVGDIAGDNCITQAETATLTFPIG